MYTQAAKHRSADDTARQHLNHNKPTVQFVDNRPEATVQRKLQTMADKSPQVLQLRAFQAMVNQVTVRQQVPGLEKENNTGLPDNLKSGIETLSGDSMDDVKVHYNSSQPAQLKAHAYAQGTDIHLGPGQEKHLPHEAWHVVQQKQGRVQPTTQMKVKQGVNINDDTRLEREADVMGAKAAAIGNAVQTETVPLKIKPNTGTLQAKSNQMKEAPIQRSITEAEEANIEKNLSKPLGKGIVDESDNNTSFIRSRMKEAQREDTDKRLHALGFGTEINAGGNWEGATVDFKHWMADGQMPMDYHYGFNVRDYYKNLNEHDKADFSNRCKGMRSSTTITRILGTYHLATFEGISADQKSAYEHTREIHEDTRRGDQVGKTDFEALLANPRSLMGYALFLISNLKANLDVRPIELRFTHIGDEIWKAIADKGLKAKENPQFKAFGQMVMDVSGEVDKRKSELPDDQQMQLKRIFGKIVRAWGDATASLGLDPYCRLISHTQSSTTDDYFRHKTDDKHSGDGGRHMADQKAMVEESEGHISWCDMFASESMWSQAANYDRYRDTIVTVYVQPDHGASLGRQTDTDTLKLRVTAAELQLGVLNAYFSGFDEYHGDMTKPMTKYAPLDARKQSDESRGGQQGLPDFRHNPGNGSGGDTVLRDLGWARLHGDGKMSFLIKTRGDTRWRKATYNGIYGKLTIPDLVG